MGSPVEEKHGHNRATSVKLRKDDCVPKKGGAERLFSLEKRKLSGINGYECLMDGSSAEYFFSVVLTEWTRGSENKLKHRKSFKRKISHIYSEVSQAAEQVAIEVVESSPLETFQPDWL